MVRIDQDEVLVDIGYKCEGVIPLNELSIRKSVDPHDEVELGEEVDALVLTKEDQDGRLILSKKRARFEKAWRKIEAAAESGEPVEGTVIEVVKGGLIIDLGVRGFLPASLVDIRRVQNLDEFLGQKIECKVIELNRSRNNVVLSRRAVLEEERKEVRQQILDRLQPGMVVEGAISNIVDFGAFVDLDGIDGLIHISELSWSHVNHPSEILSIGDVVPVKVLDIDRDRQRISLGLKQTQEDPWQRVIDTYNVGDELEGKVTKVVTFGAFVEIMDGVEGLVHISELAQHHVENPREIVEPGQDVRVKILEIDSERRRLSLSVKRVEDQLPPHPLGRRGGRGGRGGRAASSATCPTSACPRTSSPAVDERRGRRRGRPRPPRPRRRAEEARPRTRPPRRRGGRAAEAAPSPRLRRPRSPRPRRAAEARGGSPRAEEAPRPRPEPRPPRRAEADARTRASRLPAETDEHSRRPGSPGPVRGAHRRARRREVRGAARAGASWAPRRSRPTRSSTSCSRPTSCATWSWSAWARRWRRDGAIDRSAVAEPCSATTRRAWLEGVLWPRVGRARWSSGARRLADARSAAAGGRGRGAAAVRVRDGGALRRDDRRGGRRGRARAERAGARGHASVAERAGAPALAGGKGAASGLRGAQRRHARGVESRTLSRVLAETRHRTRELATPPPPGPPQAARRAPRVRRRRARRWRLRSLLLGVLVAAVVIGARASDEAVREITLPLRHDDIIRQQAADKRPRPGADRRGHLRGVEVPRPDLARRRARA